MRELGVRTREFTPLRPVPPELEERGSYGRDLAAAARRAGTPHGRESRDPDPFVREWRS
jgi:hypothetical protein